MSQSGACDARLCTCSWSPSHNFGRMLPGRLTIDLTVGPGLPCTIHAIGARLRIAGFALHAWRQVWCSSFLLLLNLVELCLDLVLVPVGMHLPNGRFDRLDLTLYGHDVTLGLLALV